MEKKYNNNNFYLNKSKKKKEKYLEIMIFHVGKRGIIIYRVIVTTRMDHINW